MRNKTYDDQHADFVAAALTGILAQYGNSPLTHHADIVRVAFEVADRALAVLQERDRAAMNPPPHACAANPDNCFRCGKPLRPEQP